MKALKDEKMRSHHSGCAEEGGMKSEERKEVYMKTPKKGELVVCRPAAVPVGNDFSIRGICVRSLKKMQRK